MRIHTLHSIGGLLWAIALSWPACGSSSSECADDPGTARALTESCCPAHGADACGAGLFCAAFDGRNVPVCYAERSRDDLASCTGDIQCRSGSCNTGPGLCRTLTPGNSTCSHDVGCVDPEGTVMACIDTGSGAECTSAGGQPFDPCGADADCNASLGLHCDLGSNTCTYSNPGQCTHDYECGGDYRCRMVSHLGYNACVSLDQVFASDPACKALACPTPVCWQYCYTDDATSQKYCEPLTCDQPM